MNDHGTSIEWTHAPGYTGESWNPIAAYHVETGKRGWFCTKPSAGCQNCYAESFNGFRGNGLKYTIGNQKMVRLELVNLAQPLRWRAPRMVFVCSMTDLFLEAHTDEMIAAVYAVMALSPRHIYQVLTKRPARRRALLNDIRFRDRVLETIREGALLRLSGEREDLFPSWPLANVWEGTTTENQKTANERVPELLATPAAVRWLSVEPMLESVSLYQFAPFIAHLGSVAIECRHGFDACPECDRGIDWVVIGGESGRGARPFSLRWASALVRQCQASHVPVFVKQMGSVPMEPEEDWRARPLTRLLNARTRDRVPAGMVPLKMNDTKGGNIDNFPDVALRVRQWPLEVNRGR